MRILAILVLILTFPISAIGKEHLPLSTLKRYIDVYLKIDGAVPIPDDERANFLYMCALFQGMITGVELADATLAPKEAILKHLDERDLNTVFRDFKGYLNRMKLLEPDANGYNILVHFIVTNYTDNASAKVKFAPLILKELKNGQRKAEPAAPGQPTTKPDDGSPGNAKPPNSTMLKMSKMKHTRLIDYRHGPKNELVWLALLASPKEAVIFERSGTASHSMAVPSKKVEDLLARVATIKDFSRHRVEDWGDPSSSENIHMISIMKKADIDGKIEEIIVYAIPKEGSSPEFIEWLRKYKGLLQGEQ